MSNVMRQRRQTLPEPMPAPTESADVLPAPPEASPIEAATRSQPSFWSWPLVTDIIFPNTVSEARDLCAGERNFLIGIKGSFALAVSGCALLLHPAGTASTFDVVFSYLLVCIALVLPVVSLYSYTHSFDMWIVKQGPVHNPNSFIAIVIFAALTVLVLNIKELITVTNVDINQYYVYRALAAIGAAFSN